MRKWSTFLFIAVLCPLESVAEVSDKITLISEQWLRAALFAGVLFALGYFRPKVALFTLIIPCLFFLGTYQLQSSDIGPDIIREQGMIYFVSMYVADVVVLAFATLGLWCGRQRQRTELNGGAT